MHPISIPLGITIGLFASFVQSLGLTIQRKSHVLNQLLPQCQQRVEHRRPLWLLGFVIFISSNIIGSLVQIASLPVVILAPLGAVSLLWNAFFARIILGDVFSPWMVLGTVLIAGGAVLIAMFGIVPEPTRSLEDLLALFSRPAFLIYFSILSAMVFICLLFTHFIEYSTSFNAINPTTSASLTHALESGPFTTTGLSEMAIVTEQTPLLDRKSLLPPPTPPWNACACDASGNRARLFIAISYASFSGIISGMCLVFAKSGVELLLLTFRGQNQFWRWQMWVLVLGLGAFALLQLWYLHKALVLADPTLVCPSFCFYNLSSIVNGLVYFDQFSLISPVHLALVGLGIVVLLGGVWVVSIQSGGKEVDVEPWGDSDDEGGDARERYETTAEPGGRDTTRTEGETRSIESAMCSETGRPDAEEGSSASVSRAVHPYRRKTTHDVTQQASLSQTVSPPVVPVSTLRTGFQIGLSPVSPGFAIVPKERGRRVSGLGVVDGVMEEERRRRRRRTVSEGDVREEGRWRWIPCM